MAQAIRIGLAFARPFSFDLIVRTPHHVKQGLKEDDRDWFLSEIVQKGIVLYEAANGAMVRKAEEDVGTAKTLAAQKKPYRDAVCFHCQQAAERYFKALLQEIGAAVPKTHDLEYLLDLLLRQDAQVGEPLRVCSPALNSTAETVARRYRSRWPATLSLASSPAANRRSTKIGHPRLTSRRGPTTSTIVVLASGR
jgi:HEPN domain-containing protein